MFNAYFEARRNGVYLREYRNGYKTLSGVRRAVKKFISEPKPAELVGVVYFTGNVKGDRSYFKENYQVVQRQGDVKAFFEFYG